MSTLFSPEEYYLKADNDWYYGPEEALYDHEEYQVLDIEGMSVVPMNAYSADNEERPGQQFDPIRRQDGPGYTPPRRVMDRCYVTPHQDNDMMDERDGVEYATDLMEIDDRYLPVNVQLFHDANPIIRENRFGLARGI